MFEKVAQLIGGVIATLIGIEAFFEGGYWSAKWGRYIDYGPYHQVNWCDYYAHRIDFCLRCNKKDT